MFRLNNTKKTSKDLEYDKIIKGAQNDPVDSLFSITRYFINRTNFLTFSFSFSQYFLSLKYFTRQQHFTKQIIGFSTMYKKKIFEAY